MREQWRPAEVRVLLVGESAPDARAGDRRFFYAPTLTRADNLFRGVVEAVYGRSPGRAGDAKAPWLERLRAGGFYLIDLVPYPVNALAAGERRRTLREYAPACVGQAVELAPAGVIVCHGPSFDVLAGTMRDAGVPMLHDARIPFPLGNWRATFIERVRDALSGLDRAAP